MMTPFDHLFSVGGGLTSQPQSGAYSDGWAAVTGDFVTPETYARKKGLKALGNNPGQGGDSVVLLDGSAGVSISPLMAIAGVLGLAWLLFGRKRGRR